MTKPTEAADSDWQVPEHRQDIFTSRSHDFILVIPVINEGERIRAQLARTAAARLPVRATSQNWRPETSIS